MTLQIRSPFVFSLISMVALAVLGATQAAHAEAVCVNKNKTALHQAPSSSSAVTWTVSENMPLLRVAQKGSWSQVKDLDGQLHWVQSNAVTSRISCAVVKTRVAKLRRAPGSHQPAAEFESADKYTPFRKVDRDGSWVLVQDEYKGRYWVNESNVWIPVVRTSVAF